jgi:hypothetical protein
LPGAPDVLAQFCKHNNILVPAGEDVPSERLFPWAVLSPGWNHIVDNLHRRMLTSLPWTAGFIKMVKALTKFLREWNVEIVQVLQQHNLPAVAESIEKCNAPTFANWRWNTLHRSIKAVMKSFPYLKEHFGKLDFVKAARDTTTIRLVRSAVACPDFEFRALFVEWCAHEFNELAEWASGCECHQEPMEAKVCKWEGKVEANFWTPRSTRKHCFSIGFLFQKKSAAPGHKPRLSRCQTLGGSLLTLSAQPSL